MLKISTSMPSSGRWLWTAVQSHLQSPSLDYFLVGVSKFCFFNCIKIEMLFKKNKNEQKTEAPVWYSKTIA